MMKINGLLLGAMVMVGSATSTLGASTVYDTVNKVQTQVQTQEVVKEQVVKVYVTKTGKKFHKANCKSLSKSKIEKDFKEVMLSNYEPCNNCHSDVECRQLKEEQKKLKEEQKKKLKEEQKKKLTIATKPSK